MSTSPAVKTLGEWLGTKKELAWLMELPGKPRTPSIIDLGRA